LHLVSSFLQRNFINEKGGIFDNYEEELEPSVLFEEGKNQKEWGSSHLSEDNH
jgi:hypothetical protein